MNDSPCKPDPEQMLQRHQGIYWKVARAFADTHADEQDLAQEIMITVWNAMASFDGEHHFELEIDRRHRCYLGPAVVGSGFSPSDGAMLGRGVWPGFGYNFSSWSVLVTADRQLTGGRFHIAGREVASIVGLAEPEPPPDDDIPF